MLLWLQSANEYYKNTSDLFRQSERPRGYTQDYPRSFHGLVFDARAECQRPTEHVLESWSRVSGLRQAIPFFRWYRGFKAVLGKIGLGRG